MSRGWMQCLLVVVPVFSLLGSWLALRTIDARRNGRRPQHKGDGEGE